MIKEKIMPWKMPENKKKTVSYYITANKPFNYVYGGSI